MKSGQLMILETQLKVLVLSAIMMVLLLLTVCCSVVAVGAMVLAQALLRCIWVGTRATRATMLVFAVLGNCGFI